VEVLVGEVMEMARAAAAKRRAVTALKSIVVESD
jgi:hypothetical protein